MLAIQSGTDFSSVKIGKRNYSHCNRTAEKLHRCGNQRQIKRRMQCSAKNQVGFDFHFGSARAADEQFIQVISFSQM